MSTLTDWKDFEQLRLVAGDLEILATSRADGPVFDAFVREYEAHYPDDGHKETPEGWIKLMGLRQSARGQALRAQFGDFVEVVALVRQRTENAGEPGALIGGLNVSLFQFGSEQVRNSGSGNYLFSLPQWRGHGYGAGLIALLAFLGRQVFAREGSRKSSVDVITAEVHDYFGSVEKTYRGEAKVLDLPYTPPQLPAQRAEAEHPLTLLLFFEGRETVDPCLLKQHLERFFVITYQKGEDIANDSPARHMLDQLEQLCRQKGTLPTISPKQWLDKRLAQQR